MTGDPIRVWPVDTDPPPQGPVRRPSGAAALAAVALLVVLYLMGSSPSSPAVLDEGLETAVVHERGLSGVTEEAADAARDLARELRLNDPGGVAALLADDWIHLELPGTLSAVPEEATADAIEFALAVADVDLGTCRADPRVVNGLVDARAICDEVDVSGAYPEAYGLAGTGQTVAVGIADDRIVSVFWSGHPVDALTIGAVCSFAQETMPSEAAIAFSPGCLPVEDPHRAEAHVAIATAYLAAGSPRDAQRLIEERHARSLVERFAAAYHEDGDPSRYVGNDGAVATMPGLAVDPEDPPFPMMDEALRWSAVVYDIELGTCRTERVGALIRVACPDASWAGPLVEGLSLDAVPQPVEFYIENQTIIIIAGDTEPGLRTGVAELCRWGVARLPGLSERAFERGCTPRHDESGAHALLALAGRFEAAG